MRLKAQLVRMAILTGVIAGVAAVSPAQTFRLENATVRPGRSAELKLFLTSPVPVAAVNFTIRANAAQLSADLDGAVAPALNGAGFLYVENSPNSVGKEYRAVVYHPTSGTTFNASAETHIATITVPAAAGLASNLVINANVISAFDTDGVTALLGVSNSSGQSIVDGAPIAAGSSTRPAVAAGGAIRIDPAVTDTPFVGGDTLTPGWFFAENVPFRGPILPAGPGRPDPSEAIFQPSIDQDLGVVIKKTAYDAFALLATDEGQVGAADIYKPGADTVLLYSWDISSNATNAFDNPTLRVRTNAADFSWFQLATYQETDPNAANQAPLVLPSGDINTTKNMIAAAYAPASAANGIGPDGLTASLDFLGFVKSDARPNPDVVDMAVKTFKATSYPLSALTGVQQHYNHNFRTNGADGFNYVGSILNVGGNFPTTQETANGLGVAPANGNFEPFPGVPGAFLICFGWYEKTFTAAGGQFPAVANRLYRVDFRLSTTVTDPAKAPTGRLRIQAGPVIPGTSQMQSDWIQEIGVETSSSDSTNFPTGAGKDYTAFFVIPAEVAGSNVQVNFDVYPQPLDHAPGALFLESMNVRSYDLPQ